jgi:hypothetical protein
MTIYTDRLKKHFDEAKSVYYEIDRPGDLRRLYTILKSDGPKGLKENNFGLAAMVCGLLHSRAVDFANAHQLPHPVAEPQHWDLIYMPRNRS